MADMREYFNLENDFTPGEELEARTLLMSVTGGELGWDDTAHMDGE